MSKQLLIETQTLKFSPKTINENVSKENGNLVVEGILATCEVKNGNGRYYAKELWEREMEKYIANIPNLIREGRKKLEKSVNNELQSDTGKHDQRGVVSGEKDAEISENRSVELQETKEFQEKCAEIVSDIDAQVM